MDVKGENMLLTAIRRALGKYWLIPFAVMLPLMLADLISDNALHWMCLLGLLLIAFTGVLAIGIPIEYHAAKNERGNEF
jgi:hypothetical protein